MQYYGHLWRLHVVVQPGCMWLRNLVARPAVPDSGTMQYYGHLWRLHVVAQPGCMWSGSASAVSRRTGSSTAGDGRVDRAAGGGQTATCGHGDGRLRAGFSAGSSGPRMTAASSWRSGSASTVSRRTGSSTAGGVHSGQITRCRRCRSQRLSRLFPSGLQTRPRPRWLHVL